LERASHHVGSNFESLSTLLLNPARSILAMSVFFRVGTDCQSQNISVQVTNYL